MSCIEIVGIQIGGVVTGVPVTTYSEEVRIAEAPSTDAAEDLLINPVTKQLAFKNGSGYEQINMDDGFF